MQDGDQSRGLDRRTVLALTGGTLGAYAALASGLVDLSRCARAEPTPDLSGRRALSGAEWHALDAAQARLLPSDEFGPGARDVNAIGYLDAALVDPSVSRETRQRIKDGAARLDQRAQAAGARSFARLDPKQQDAAIHQFERHPDGIKWLKHMLGFTLEALFGDPTHGGNPGEIGWRWAGDDVKAHPRPKTPGWKPEERR